jgi:hypothetical protein
VIKPTAISRWVAGALLILCSGRTSAFAQDDTSGQLWSDYHAHYYTSEKNEFYGDGGLRIGGGSDKFWRIYARPSIRYHYTEKLRFLGGLGLFYTDNKDAVNMLEIRPWHGLRYKWPTFGKVTLNNLFRLEERITFPTDSWDGRFQLRFRYQLSTQFSLMKVPWNGFYIPLSAEAFWDVGDKVDVFADDGRLSTGIGYVANDVWIFTLLLIVEQSRSTKDESFAVADIIIRFQIKQLLSKRDFRGRIEAPDT